MTQNLEASQISLNDVRRLLKLERQTGGSFTDFFSMEPLTDFEQQALFIFYNTSPDYQLTSASVESDLQVAERAVAIGMIFGDSGIQLQEIYII